MCSASPDSVGLGDYLQKRDFRRDLDKEIRREGYDFLRPNKDLPLGEQPYPAGVDSTDPITVTAQVRRPNGKLCLIAGNKNSLYRYFSLDNGAYFSEDPADYPAGQDPFYITPNISPNNPPFTPYIDDNPGDWIRIGTGFSSLGHRWEAVEINGYLIFNNGVDLPLSYREEDLEAVPIYELREQGIASVGTIAVFGSRLILGDITEIDDLETVLAPISSGAVTAAQAGATWSGSVTAIQWDGVLPGNSGYTVTADQAFFTVGMVGKTLRWSDGRSAMILTYGSPTVVIVGGPSRNITARRFFVTRQMVFSGTIEGTQSGTTVNSTGPIFTSAMADAAMGQWYVRFDDGSLGKITGFTDNYTVTLNTTQTVAEQPFRIIPPEFVVLASAPVFEVGWDDQRMLFADGTVRVISDFVSTTIVLTTQDPPITSQAFVVDNPSAYGAVAATVATTRVQYRIIPSEQDEPRRFALVVSGAIAQGSNRLRLKYPTDSFQVGDSIILTDAGPNAGNVTATVLMVAEMGTALILDGVATTAVDEWDGDVLRASSIGSGVAYTDLQGDSSGILRMLTLRETTLVVYKETTIFQGTFTGDPANLLQFEEIANDSNLHFRWTVIEVGNLYHLYAGKSHFYRYDLTNRIPVELPIGALAESVFFTEASITNSDFIFAADNQVTREIFVFFPSNSDDQAIVFDYRQNTVSTSSAYFSAAGTVKRPLTGIDLINEDWFVMGDEFGAVLQYGLVAGPDETFGSTTVAQAGDVVSASAAIFTKQHVGRTIRYADKTAVAIVDYLSPTQVNVDEAQTKASQAFAILPAIWHRCGTDYTSRLKSGLNGIGDDVDEKEVGLYVLYLAGQSPNSTLTVNILGALNTADGATVLATKVFANAIVQNSIPLHLKTNYIQDEVVVEGRNNPLLISARSYQAYSVNSQSFVRASDS